MKTFIKKYFTSIIIVSCLFIGATANAQELQVDNEQVMYKDNTYPAIVVYMEPDTKEVKKAWQDYIKDKYDIRLHGLGFLVNRDVLSAEGVDFQQISPDKMDFYTKVVEDNDQTKMAVFASLGYDIQVGSQNHYTGYYNMKNIVQDFLDTFLPNYYQDKINDAENRISDLQKTQEDKRNQIADNQKEINDLQAENNRLNQEISNTENEWRDAKDNLATLQQKLEEVRRQLASISNPYYNSNYNNQ